MEPEKRSLKAGAIAILLAVVLRLITNGTLQPILQSVGARDLASMMMYLETGRLAGNRPPASEPPPAEPPEPEETVPSAQQPLRFTREDLSSVQVRYDGDYRPDLEKWITAPVELKLQGREPTVLILHTHGCESFDDVSPGVWRTPDPKKNMIAVGDVLERRLMDAGISVIHDRELHDYPSYNGSYVNSREAAEHYLQMYPSISLILDLHRDAADVGDGQLDTSAQVDGKESAQILVVVGTDEGGLDHPHWEDNLSLGLKLAAQLEKTAPGISRYVGLRTERFNQDLGEHALLIEVGAAGNTLDEAKLAADVLSDAVIALSNGAAAP